MDPGQLLSYDKATPVSSFEVESATPLYNHLIGSPSATWTVVLVPATSNHKAGE